MANRSYLFATDLVPSPGVKPRDGRMIGISEWNCEVPIAFKLLLTGKPRMCTSSIWEGPGLCAISGDYAAGVKRLLSEIDQVSAHDKQELHAEAEQFFADPANQREYFVLECTEIFYLSAGSPAPAQQNERLFADIMKLAMATSPVLVSELPKRRPGVISSLLGLWRPRSPSSVLASQGLGNWCNELYYAPAGEPPGDE